MLGHRAKKSVVGLAQGPEPPIQPWKPVSTRWMPISITVGPVTIGGNTRSMTFGGRKAIATTMRAHSALDPTIATSVR